MVYFDHAATTRLKPEALGAMIPYLTENFGNASSVYTAPGQAAREGLESARHTLASLLGAKDTELFFTAGGSESDNWAIKGVAFKNRDRGTHIITTTVEHHAVLHTCQWLETQGFSVTYLPVDEYGQVSAAAVEAAIRPDTILVSVMFANNEIGTVNPIAEIGALCRERGVYFHTDAVQAAGTLPINVAEMKIDLLSMSAHKFHGPKGVGALYIRSGVKIDNLIHGGAQERGRRAATENVAGVVGMATAFALAADAMEERAAKVSALRDRMIAGIEAAVPYCRLNGHRTMRLPNNVSFCFRYIEGEYLLLLLQNAGFVVSSGSACTSGSLDPSHVLLAIGLPHEIAHGSMRATLSEENTAAEVDAFVGALQRVVEHIRTMSPLYEEAEKRGEVACIAKK